MKVEEEFQVSAVESTYNCSLLCFRKSYFLQKNVEVGDIKKLSLPAVRKQNLSVFAPSFLTNNYSRAHPQGFFYPFYILEKKNFFSV